MRTVPSQADFQLPRDRNEDLDGWHAWETFGGRTIEDAYTVFSQNVFFYLEDLMWMAPKPFCFYLPIALRYLQSPESARDSDAVSCLASTIEFQLDRAKDISAAFPCIANICDYVLSNYGKFEVNEDIYGALRSKYRALRTRLGESSSGASSASPSG